MRFLASSEWLLRSSLVSLAFLLQVSCRPSNYAPPAPDPTVPPLNVPLGTVEHLRGDDLRHAAIYGAESAPQSALTPPDDATISPTGLVSAILTPGSGDQTPKPGETVVFHLTGWTQTGERFESTEARGRPDRADPQTLVPGFREGLEHMVVGEKRRLWVPERLAYGPNPPPGKPFGELVVDIELLEILEAPKVPDTPADVAGAPDGAQITASGVRYVVLQKGYGERRPTRADRVEVHYTGWDKAGVMFDSSVARGTSAQFGVGEVIPGWTEMLQQMVEGEKVRVWIPSKQAYGDSPDAGRPAGDLVFEVELLRIL